MNDIFNISEWAAISNLVSAAVVVSYHLFSSWMLRRNGVGEAILRKIEDLVSAIKEEAKTLQHEERNTH